MHPIQDLFLEGFSYVLQFNMHFICTPICTKFYSCKNGCYIHHGRSNKYTLTHKGKITLLPLMPNEIVQCNRT
jgi:hypothetical protein